MGNFPDSARTGASLRRRDAPNQAPACRTGATVPVGQKVPEKYSFRGVRDSADCSSLAQVGEKEAALQGIRGVFRRN
jgi:hypothetical protein